MKLKGLSPPFVLVILMSGCVEPEQSEPEQPQAPICSKELVFALNVEVLDQRTGRPNACGASVTVEDGSFSEYLALDNTNCEHITGLALAAEREGNYNITVSKEGYADWYAESVKVSSNECHVNPVSVQAYLEP